MELEAVRRMFSGLPVVSVATVDPDGTPHVVPLWFVWPEDALYISTRREGRTWRNASADPRVAVTIDLGRSWTELAGAVLTGRAELLPAEQASMRRPISAWHEKYRSLLAGEGFTRFTEQVRQLGFLRVDPESVRTWDHARS